MRFPLLRAIGPLLVLVTTGAHDRDPLASITLSPSTVVGGNTVNGTFTLATPAPSGGSAVTLTTSSLALAGFVDPRLGPASAVATLSLTIPQGVVSTSFTLRTFGVATSASVVISGGGGGESATAAVTLTPAAVTSLAFSPQSVTGGQTVTGTLTLNGEAPAVSGVTIPLAATQTAGRTATTLTATVPPSVTLRPLARRASFTVGTPAVTGDNSVVVTATLGGTAQGSFRIVPPVLAVKSLAVSPSTFPGGTTATGAVALTVPAPAGGATVNLSSSSRGITVPSSLAIAQGVDRGNFPVTGVDPGVTVTATITASVAATSTSGGISDGSSNTLVTTEQPPPVSTSVTSVAVALQSIQPRPNPVTGGTNVLLSIVPASSLTSPVTVKLSSSQPTVLSVPASATVSPGRTTTVTLATTAVKASVSVVVTVVAGAQQVSTKIAVSP